MDPFLGGPVPHVGPRASSVMAADFADIFESDSDHAPGPLEAAGGDAQLAVVGAAPRQQRAPGAGATRPKGPKATPWGSGRWGSARERRGLALRMVAARMTKMRERHAAKQASELRTWARAVVDPALGKKRKVAALEVSLARRVRASKSTLHGAHTTMRARVGSLKVVFRDRRGQRAVSSASAMLAIGYDHSAHSNVAKAEKHGVDQATVGRSAVAVAVCYMWLQEMMLERILVAMRSSPT